MTSGVMDWPRRGTQHRGSIPKERSMQPSPILLRRVLWADAATSVACGVIQLAALDLLSRTLALPSTLLLDTGVFYLAYGALVAWAASRAEPPRALVLLFAFGNIGWALLCVAAL